MHHRKYGDKLFRCWAIMVIIVLIAAGCGAKQATPDTDNNAEPESSPNNPVATIEMENGKTIEIELYPDVAPNTVNNFISLAKQGFYDGTIFHRVIPGFMIQGGDPEGTGRGGPGYAIKGEFTANKFTNNLKHTRGVISMARGRPNDSAGSQFFLMHDAAPHLDGSYAAFGKVVSGIETIDEIAAVPTTGNPEDRPLQEQKMKRITIDTKGVNYKEPETIR